MYTLGVASGNVGGANCDTLPPATGVVAISWSPKGKQMVAVKKDGSLTQYKPDLKEAKSWPGPSKAGLLPVSIFWLSTYEFLVGYREGEERPGLWPHVLWTNMKSGNPYNVKVFLTHISV